MRAFVVALALLFAFTATADARRARKGKKAKRVAVTVKEERPRSQSVGAPNDGFLEHATRLRFGDGVLIRRPERAFGTRTTVDHVRRAVNDTLERFPRAHTLAIGDLSIRDGGRITDHRSHQSGRDVDIGLFYKQRPRGYPESFVRATEDNLDPEATWALISRLVDTANEDGGVQMIFLDIDVQAMIYDWAAEHGVSPRKLARVFQYPNGEDEITGIVRHQPNHDNHMHVRFQCAAADVDCEK